MYLARSIHVSSVSIDHISKDVAFDASPAPRQIRVWGVVDGQENLAKLKNYREGLEVRRELETLSAEEREQLTGDHVNLEISFAYRALPSGSSTSSKAQNGQYAALDVSSLRSLTLL